jgi:hypothetical protein
VGMLLSTSSCRVGSHVLVVVCEKGCSCRPTFSPRTKSSCVNSPWMAMDPQSFICEITPL